MADPNACFPRITGQSDVLSTLVGQNVMLVGKVVHVQDGVSVVQGCTGADVSVVLSRDTSHVLGTIVEVLGTVQPDLTVRELKHVVFSEDFDMESYAKLVGLANGRFKSLFGPTA